MVQAHPAAAPWAQPASAADSLVPVPHVPYPPMANLAFSSAQSPPGSRMKPARRGRPPKGTTARGTKRKGTPAATNPLSDPARTMAPGAPHGYAQSVPVPVAEVLTALAGAAALTASMLAAPTPAPPSAIIDPGSPTEDSQARNKPGRKPLNDVPSTKRTAQNRASQRAFRERRQAHLAELEEKVKRYETERSTIASQLAMLAQRVRDETPRIHALEAVLQARDNEIAQWRARCTDLSRALDALQAVVRAPAQAPVRSPMRTSFASGPGSATPVNRTSRSLNTPSSDLPRPDRRTSSTVNGSDEQAGTSPASIASSSADTPPPNGPDPTGRMEMAAINMPSTFTGMGMGIADMGNTLPALGSLTGILPPAVSPSSPIEESKDPSTPTQQGQARPNSTEYECGFCEGNKALCICRADSSPGGVEFPPPPESPASHVPEQMEVEDDSGCGACSKGGDCACRGDGIIDFDAGGASSDGPSPPAKQASSTSLPSSRRDARSPGPQPSTSMIDHTMSLSLAPLALTGDALPLRLRRSDKGKEKLWSVDPTTLVNNSSTFATRPAASSSSAVHVHRPITSRRGNKLWVTSTPECSGDPRTCAACGTDPELAAFCEAVNEDELSEEGEQGDGAASGSHNRPTHTHNPRPPPNPSFPLSREVGRPPSPPNLDHAETSVPEAWRRIRSHPHFQEFTHESGSGGLHLLADVVAGRHPTSDAPSSRSSPVPAGPTKPLPRNRDPTSGEAAVRRASGLFALATLTRSAVEEPRGRDGSRSTRHEPTSSHRTRSASCDTNDADEPVHKRRRLYVDNDGIRNALALLDRGALSDPRRRFSQVWSDQGEPLPDPRVLDV